MRPASSTARISRFLGQPGDTDGPRSLRGHMGRCFCARFGHTAQEPQRLLLATASEDQTARIWDVTTGECVRVLSGHADEVLRVAWSPCGETLVTGGADGKAMVWRTGDDWCKVATLEHGDGAQIYACQFQGAPHSHKLLAASNNRVTEWDVNTQQQLSSWTYSSLGSGAAVHGGTNRNPDGAVDVFDLATTAALGGGATLIAVAVGDGSLRLTDLRTASSAGVLRREDGAPRAAAQRGPTFPLLLSPPRARARARRDDADLLAAQAVPRPAVPSHPAAAGWRLARATVCCWAAAVSTASCRCGSCGKVGAGSHPTKHHTEHADIDPLHDLYRGLGRGTAAARQA